MKSWINKKAQIKTSVLHGLGLFAVDTISKDEIIVIKSGYPMPKKSLYELYDKYNFDVEFTDTQISDDVFLGPIDADDVIQTATRVNHSCDPNGSLVTFNAIKAARNIRAGEEITIDYRTSYTNKYRSFACQCGSKKCQGVVVYDGPPLDTPLGLSPLIEDKYKKLVLSKPKSVCILAALHGDETFGIDIYTYFRKNYPGLSQYVYLIIGNSTAYKKHKRFIDRDLNRAYGKDDSIKDMHEYTELNRIKKRLNFIEPNYILDIHTTRRDTGIFILSKDTAPSIKKIVNKLPNYPLILMKHPVIKTSFVGNHPSSVSIEYSYNMQTEDELRSICESIASLIEDRRHEPTARAVYTVRNLISKEEFDTSKTVLKNYTDYDGRTAIMVPKSDEELDAEYHGFWATKSEVNM